MSTQPIRIQRRRTRGFVLQAQSPDGRPVVSVTRPGRWGNPYLVGLNGTAQQCVDQLRAWLAAGYRCWPLDELIAELRGKHLACWCKVADECGNYVPCHADVLLSLANGLTLDEIRHENLKNHSRQQGTTP